MPRGKNDSAKTATELDAEITRMKQEIAAKQKALQVAKRRENAEKERIRAFEEAAFNREFVAKAMEIRQSNFSDGEQTAYDLIRAIIRPDVSLEPVQATGDAPEQDGAATGLQTPDYCAAETSVGALVAGLYMSRNRGA